MIGLHAPTMRRFTRSRLMRCGLVVASVAALSSGTAQRAAGFAQQETIVTLARGRVGQLRLGMIAGEVVALFGRNRVKAVDLHREGGTTPALEVRLDSLTATKASLIAELFPVASNRVWRVRVFDSRFKTDEGLSIGSTLAEIQAHHKVRMLVGEGNVVAFAEDLQMSFDFSQWFPDVNIPPTARVESIIVLLPPSELPK